MKKETFRKALIIAVIIIGLLFIFFSLNNEIKNFIVESKAFTLYSEEDVDNLEYILKEYYSTDYTDEELKKSIIYSLESAELDKIADYRKGSMYSGLQEYINEQLKFTKKDRADYSQDTTFNDTLIKQGDYRTLAEEYLKSYNEEETNSVIADYLDEIDDTFEIVIGVVFIIIYAYVVLKFTFLTEFDKKTYAKTIFKYLMTLLAIFILNILVAILFEKYISSFGYLDIFDVSSIINYGLLVPLSLFIIFIISIIINALLNIKDIIKCSKTKKVAKQ